MQSTLHYENLVIETFVVVSSGLVCYFLAYILVNVLCFLYIRLMSLWVFMLKIKILTIPDLIANSAIHIEEEEEEEEEAQTDYEENDMNEENVDISLMDLYHRINELEQTVIKNQRKYHLVIYRMNQQLARLLGQGDDDDDVGHAK
jgi:hypothetical protein